MKKRIPFVHKLLGRLDKVDQNSVSNYLLGLVDSKALYEEILHHLSEGVWVVSRSGRVRFINRQASLWFDVPASDWQGMAIREGIIDPSLRKFVVESLEDLSERKIGDFSILMPREMRLRVSLSPMESSSDDILVLMEDLSPAVDGQMAGERMARMESLLKLAAGVAHEIGNPLNSIGIHLQLLRKQLKERVEGGAKSFEKTIDVITNETERLDKIIKGFLGATRKPPLRFKPENLNRIIEEVLAVLGPELEKKQIQVKCCFDDALPLFLMDRERMYQALVNLILNAEEAMPKGGELRIDLSHKGKVAVLKIEDTGIGIADENLPHIFEPYYTTKKEGSGLGLMSIYNIISEHGGRIEVSSRPEKGTVFTIQLPIREPKLQLPQMKVK